MIYHYLSWGVGEFPAESFMGRIGLYGVSIFYILSGLTLYHVYSRKMVNVRAVRDFFIKRVFRIFPLLWIVTLAAIVLSREMPNFGDLFLNLTGLFGFVKWDTYFSAGVWSIGNELVFYAMFPIMAYCARSSTGLLALCGLVLLAPYIYFAFWGMTPSGTLTDQWTMYINPLNQAFLFFAGFAIGYVLKVRKVPQLLAWLVFLGSIVAFALIPAEGEPVTLVTGVNRLVFTLLCVLICASAYKMTIDLPRVLHLPLSRLGEASYSVYLIHPLTYSVVAFALNDFVPVPAQIVIAVVVTLILSWVCYRYFEQYFMRLGRRATRADQPAGLPKVTAR